MNHSPWKRLGLLAVPILAAMTAALLIPKSAPAAAVPVRIDAIPPEFTAGQWLNTPDSKPITLASLKGKVVIVHFWTFG